MKLRCRIFCLGECAKSIVSPAVLWGAILICFDVHKKDFYWGLYEVDLELILILVMMVMVILMARERF